MTVICYWIPFVGEASCANDHLIRYFMDRDQVLEASLTWPMSVLRNNQGSAMFDSSLPILP